MADYSPASIIIGGKLKKRKLKAFLEVLNSCDFQGSNTDGPCSPENGEELLRELDTEGRLDMWDESARWGRFEELEDFCEKNKLWFQRHTSGFYDHPEHIAFFRPGFKEARSADMVDGYDSFRREDVIEMLKDCISIQAARRMFTEEQGVLNDMPSLEIVDDG